MRPESPSVNYEITVTSQRPASKPNFELELRNSRHAARIWETASGWVWSCKRCEARGVGLESMVDAMTGAVLHLRGEVPWWRKTLDWRH